MGEIMQELKKIASDGCGVERMAVKSHFWWDGKLDDASEARIIFSCTGANEVPQKADVLKAITENHSDETPMILNYEDSEAWKPTNPVIQMKLTGVTNPDLGAQMVQARLAGCAQYAAESQTLFLKTTDKAKAKLEEKVTGQSMEVSHELVDANKDYADWMVDEVDTKGANMEL